MAQMTVARFGIAAAVFWVFQSLAFAQPAIPPDGLAAEGAGRWDDAIRIYRAELGRDAHRADLWMRVADIEARMNRPADVVAALEQALRVSPANAALQFRLSQAYAQRNEPTAALQCAERASAIEPSNAEYVEATATLATWSGQYSLASRAYRHLAKLRPGDADLALKLARVTAWAGLTDESARAYREYLAANPDAAAAWLELAKTESWRGNYAAAVDALNAYRDRFGATPEYSVLLANVLAAGGKPDRAIDLLDPLLRANPNQYEAMLARTLALTVKRQIGAARQALESARRLDESNPETRKSERLVQTTLGSTIEPGFTFYSDSDRLQVARFAPTATWSLVSGTDLSGGYERAVLTAPAPSGLGRADGGMAKYESVWAGAAQTFGLLRLSGRVGSATADDHRLTPYMVGARVRASDALTIGADRAFDFFVISPRTIELGVTQTRNHASFDWTPTLRSDISADAVYQNLSDGNQRWEVTVSPRRAFARTESFNLDFGASAYLLGTSHDLPDGYYDPRRYESYEAVAFPYFKISENAGVAVSLAAGVQRENSSAFEFGGNAAAQLSLGIYRAWLLKVGATLTHNRRLESGAFQGYGGSIALTRRF